MSLISLITKGLKNKVQPHVPMWLVMGNESCDLDSAVSAIAYSALLAREGLATTFVLNVARSDYPLKTEVRYWLNKHGLTHEYLVFRDDLHIEDDTLHLQRPCRPAADLTPVEVAGQCVSAAPDAVAMTSVRVCLVDHHVLAQKDAMFKPYVERFVDHRPLEPGHVAGSGSIHSLVGSCCTLVTELLQQQQQQQQQQQKQQKQQEQKQQLQQQEQKQQEQEELQQLLPALAPLLHGCILLDCVNCLPAAGRATPRDEAALCLLETFMPPTDRSAVFEELTAAKASVSHLTSAQLLLRDAKMVHSVRVSGLTTTAREFLSREDALEALQESCHNTSVSSGTPLGLTVVVGLRLRGDTPFRDLVVFSRDPGLLTRACATLQEGKLELRDLTSVLDIAAPLRYFEQRNVKATRKQILPLVQRFVAAEVAG